MQIAFLTALGVGGATIVGGLLGFLFKRVSVSFQDITMSAAAGVMLASSVVGLFLPVFDLTERFAWLNLLIGVLCGGLCLNAFDRILPVVEQRMDKTRTKAEQRHKVLLFVTAIAVHNLPEGLAAGVSFGTGSVKLALTVALGIALQNLPEGMVIIAPLLSVGFSARRTMLIAFGTGLSEMIGTMIGYFAVTVSAAILPFALSFAGGCMMYVIVDEMVPETHGNGHDRRATYAFLLGFCVMLIVGEWLA